MELMEFIEQTEKSHFRTASDTGANPNALFIWNLLREHAGLPRLTKDDLMHRHAELTGESYEELVEGKKWIDRCMEWQRDTGVLRRHKVPHEYWPANPAHEKG